MAGRELATTVPDGPWLYVTLVTKASAVRHRSFLHTTEPPKQRHLQLRNN